MLVIRRLVAERFKVGELALTSDVRTESVAHARHVAMYLCRELTPATYAQIGRVLGNRERTTVMHGVKRVSRLVADYPWFRACIEELKQELVP
jgi:chromosomal replication initiator protein